MPNPPKPLFEWIKCLTRRYIILSIIVIAVLINTLFYIVEFVLQKNGYTPDLLWYQLILIIVTIFVVCIVILVFLTSLDGLRDKMVLNLKKLIGIIRRQTEEDRSKDIVIENMSCDDEVHEIVEVLNMKNRQIDQYVNHLHYVIGYIQHEFNTPLATLSLWLERLKKKHNDIDIEPFQEDIQSLSSIMNSLASLSDSHEVLVEKNKILVYPLLERIALDLATLYPTISIVIEWKKTTTVLSHELYLHIILRNLIENACKYSNDESTVTIIITDSTIVIRDTWVWMSKESLENMRKPFWQIDKSRGVDKWFGLWLTLVKRLARLLDISVTSTSVLDEWTEFTLHFEE